MGAIYYSLIVLLFTHSRGKQKAPAQEYRQVLFV